MKILYMAQPCFFFISIEHFLFNLPKHAVVVLVSLSPCLHLCLGGLFSKTEMSEVLTEILKVDPSFDKDSFLKQCERDFIPNILEVSWSVSNCKQVDL